MDSIPESNALEDTINADSMVVENGPVDYTDQDHDDVEYEEEEDVHLSVAQLMGQEYGDGECCNSSFRCSQKLFDPHMCSKNIMEFWFTIASWFSLGVRH